MQLFGLNPEMQILNATIQEMWSKYGTWFDIGGKCEKWEA